jgi:hypothetical protein
VIRCLDKFKDGHTINIFRTGGKEFLDTYGKVSFFVVEPQQSDGSTAVLCSWTQKTLQPVVPDWCKEKVTMDYFQKAFECGVRYEFEVWDPKEYNSEISRQDKAGGDPASKP